MEWIEMGEVFCSLKPKCNGYYNGLDIFFATDLEHHNVAANIQSPTPGPMPQHRHTSHVITARRRRPYLRNTPLTAQRDVVAKSISPELPMLAISKTHNVPKSLCQVTCFCWICTLVRFLESNTFQPYSTQCSTIEECTSNKVKHKRF